VPACPQCGQENPEGFKFCGACAAPLAEVAPAEAEERKLVSVLFVDVVGHTAASDRADPEDVRARLRPYHQLLKGEIERYGGTVEKFIGDAVMAVFGAPVSHEDDAERAVRSALRILEAVEELELEVRAAIATGEAVVSLQARPEQGEGIVAGDVVNTASRLQQEAPAGSLVVGEVTYRATRDAVEYEELAPVTVKGKAEPVSVWRALQARGRFGVDAEPAPTSPFVGREHDLALLQDAYARAVREQAVQLVTIGGEPGVGKTRLVAEFRSWLDDRPERIRWRQGRCLPYGEGITFWALGEVVKAQAGILESDSPETAANKLETAVRADVEDESEHEWLVSRLAPLVGARADSSGAVEQSESFTAWRRFLERLAAQRPLVLLFEDLHWADAALCDFLDELVDWASGVPILVLCTARPELYERNPGWGGGKRSSTTLSLSPLTEDETARLISALLSRAVLPAETQAALLERAGGNPLYAEEFVRMLSDQGMLTEQGELVREGEITLPETVHALIAARLDTLAPERKALLHDASVVGKVFWPGAVASIGGTDGVAVRERLRELVRKELVRPARASSVEGEDEFSFWHALVRDVAYGQIPRAARAEKHRAAAEWLEATAGERFADQAELLAYHYGEALGLARAAGQVDETEQLEERTRRFLLLAGERAQQLDLGQAELFYRRALELLPAGHPDRARALQKAGKSVFAKGDLAEAERLLEQALGEFRRRGDVLGVGEATLWLSRSMRVRGDVNRSSAMLDDAIALLEREPPSQVLADAQGLQAMRLAVASRSREALAAAERALPLAEKFGSYGLRLALMARGTARVDLGDPGGLDDLREAVRRALDRDADGAVTTSNNLAGSQWLVEGPALALETARTGIELAERRGALGPGLWCRAETVWRLFDLGRWDELLQVADEVVEADRARGGSQVELIALPYRAKVLLLRGDLRAAASLVEEFLPRAREMGDPQILVPALISAALVEQAHGNTGEGRARVGEFADVTRDRAAWTRGVHLPDALRLLTSAGELELAETLPPTETEVDTRTKHAVETARAILAEARAEPEQAAERYARAAERWAEYGSVFERAHALFGHGRCLVALGRSGEAEEHLREAREIFLGLGAAPLVAELDALLGGDAAATGS
jgi:class 3 adenylate cyclase/tetratricopeptide (TPR) repeat protein